MRKFLILPPRPPHPLRPFVPLLALLLLPALLPATARADSILITEVVTDPQADHSENTGGNGVPFDDVPGAGTVSSVDEFVELYNAGAVPVDLRGYALEFVDSTPSRYVFGASTTGVVRFSPGSGLAALQPGAFVLLGNPPGALNNALQLVLYGPDGGLADRWAEFDGNAHSAADEAVTRRWTGSRFVDSLARAAVSPLAPPPAAPEPAAWMLATLSALGAALARRRRAGSATSRTRPRSPGPPSRPRRVSPGAS